jgi:glycerol-3-phosphate acyltransferase PlsY
MTLWIMLFLIVAAYLLGSIPFGIIIAKMHGLDLRSIGSGNIGATNVSRALGRKWAYTCFGLDVLKGMIPTLLACFLANPASDQSQTNQVIILWLWLAVGCAAVIGHIFPIYLGFKGGKGVSTSFGVALGLWPYYTFCAIAAIIVWIVVALIWRYVSLASIAGSIAFLITSLLEFEHSLASAGCGGHNTADGHNPPSPEYPKTPRRLRKQNIAKEAKSKIVATLSPLTRSTAA